MKGRGKNNLECIGLCILAGFPIYPYFVLSLSIIIYCILTIINFFTKPIKSLKTKGECFLLFAFYFFLVFFTFFVDASFEAIKDLQSSMVLFVIPIIYIFFSTTNLSPSQFQKVLKIFVGSSLMVGILILFLPRLYNYSNFDFYLRLRDAIQKIQYWDFHPVYLSLYFTMSLFILGYFYKRIESKSTKILVAILILFFAILILLLVSRIAIISFLFSILFLSLARKKYIKKGLFISGIVFTFIILISFNFSSMNKQWEEIIGLKNVSLPYGKFPTSPQIRVGLYHCSFQTIKENYGMGIGVENFQNSLNQCYQKFNNFEKNDYNSHNYYLYLLGSGGIVCLVLFIISIYIQLRLFSKNKNPLFLAFTLTIVIFSLTENILSRSYGALFFTFFILLFISQKHNIEIQV